MKLINTKTVFIMLAGIVVLGLNGCDTKTGIPDKIQLVGSSEGQAPVELWQKLFPKK